MLAATAFRIAFVLSIGLATTARAQQLDELAPWSEDSSTSLRGAIDGAPELVPAATPEPISAEAIAAAEDEGERLIISLEDRLLYWMDGPDTLRVAPVAIGKGTRLEHGDTAWEFSTPQGVRRVLSKEVDPVWTPPDWHYVELARDSGLVLVTLLPDSAVRLRDGSEVLVRGDRVARRFADGRIELVPPDEEVIFGDTLFIPPHGTANRRVAGELGEYALDLGDGYMIHGTPHKTSIGTAATHGCIRMRDGDLEHLYYRVPVGTPVYIY